MWETYSDRHIAYMPTKMTPNPTHKPKAIVSHDGHEHPLGETCEEWCIGLKDEYDFKFTTASKGEKFDVGLKPEKVWNFIEQALATREQEARNQVLDEAVAIFSRLPDDEIMTKNPVILELDNLKSK